MDKIQNHSLTKLTKFENMDLSFFLRTVKREDVNEYEKKKLK